MPQDGLRFSLQGILSRGLGRFENLEPEMPRVIHHELALGAASCCWTSGLVPRKSLRNEMCRGPNQAQ